MRLTCADAFTNVQPEQPTFKWNQFGFMLGGPVQIPGLFNGRDKLFFMANYEGFRLRQQQQSWTTRQPSPCVTETFPERRSSTAIQYRSAVSRQPDSATALTRFLKRLLHFIRAERTWGRIVQGSPCPAEPSDQKRLVHGPPRLLGKRESFWFGRFSGPTSSSLRPH